MSVEASSMQVWCVWPQSLEEREMPHIFSTKEKALEYANAHPMPCVCWDYIIDQTERTEARTQ